MNANRMIILVIDACGVGELPDADEYGDAGASTIPHTADAVGGLKMPVCQKLGLGNIVSIAGVPPAEEPSASFGKMAERSAGKDSTTGHWEMAGIVVDTPFPVFPDGFPDELIDPFTERVGVGILGNEPASGTEIIAQLGEEHLRTGKLIVYTSADSVFQIAAHEDLYPVDRLYEICEIARELCTGPFAVGRVIARPFVGRPGNFTRTSRRRDFSRTPESDTVLDVLAKYGRKVLSIGKIYDLFAGRGIDMPIKTADNREVMTALRLAIRDNRDHSLIFGNCVDFDMLWGHRRDPVAFARGLEEFDSHLKDVLDALRDDDVLIITADHGCDPTFEKHTDHTREYVPLLVYGKSVEPGTNLGVRATFADLAATVARNFELKTSFDATPLEV